MVGVYYLTSLCHLKVLNGFDFYLSLTTGRDSSEASNADGSVLKISCGSGYELNLQVRTTTVRVNFLKLACTLSLGVIFYEILTVVHK